MSAPLRVMIVDDEAPAREGLRIRLNRESDVSVIGEYGDVSRAIEAIRADPPDLLFLDIEMPLVDGFAMLSRLENVSLPVVVFVTAHPDHAVRAFGVRAIDYLLKPVDQKRLSEAVARARAHWESARKAEIADRVLGVLRDADRGMPAVESSSHGVSNPLRIPVRRDGGIQFVAPSEIDWIEAAGDSVRIHAGKATHLVRKSMGDVLALLDGRSFLRIHRSTIVNIDRVRELQPYFHGEYVVVLRDGAKLKLSRGYRDSLARLLGSVPE
ncbi:MAG: LytTR family DNA-binding domain-containing protein [Gemmatimonadota bacterium]|nr:LytTR family DNA-binding domain-containing protein [Gemmatimonadota bacterium]